MDFGVLYIFTVLCYNVCNFISEEEKEYARVSESGAVRAGQWAEGVSELCFVSESGLSYYGEPMRVEPRVDLVPVTMCCRGFLFSGGNV